MQAQKAPNFTLPHVSGRQVSLSDYRARPVVVVFGGRGSKDQVSEICGAMSSRYTADALPIIQIANMKGVPRMFHGLAKRDMQKAYEKDAAKLADSLRAAGQSVPADLSHLVIMVLDWEGDAVSSFGVGDLDKQAYAYLISPDGDLQGSATGPQAAQQLLALVG